MKKIRVGIIGQGRSGSYIHRHLFESQEPLKTRFELVAVADHIPERCEGESGVTPSPELKKYGDYKEMLKDQSIDLIVNATRSMDHVPVSIEAMVAGHNVVCEKPLARHVADVDKVAEAAKRTGKFFAVFQQSRFRPLFRKCLEVMNSGILGRIVMVKIAYNLFGRRWDWQTIQDMCASELLNTGPHPLDQAIQFYGDADPEKIVCTMDRANTFGDAEDHIKLLLMGKGHPTIDFEVSRCCMFPGNTYEIYGTNGGLKAGGAEVTWKYFLPSEAPVQQLVREPLEGPGRIPCYCCEQLHFYEEKWTAPDYALGFDAWGTAYYEQVYDALVNGKPMEVTLDQIRRQIMIIEECHRQNPFPKMK